MELRYTLTRDEYVQFCAAKWGVRSLGSLLALLVGLGAILLTWQSSPSDLSASGAGMLTHVVWIGIIAAFWMAIIVQLRKGQKSRGGVWPMRVAAVAVWVTALVFAIAKGAEFPIGLAVLAAAWAWGLPLLLRCIHRWQWAMDHLHGEKHLTLMESGIRCIDQRSMSVYSWAAVQEIEELPDLLLLKLGSLMYILVSKRAFASSQDREQFVAEVKARLLPVAQKAAATEVA